MPLRALALVFSHFFCFVNLSLFLTWNAIKLYRQWVPCRCNPSYSFPLIVLKLCRCFLHGMKMCIWFGYNTLVIFSYFFCFVNLVFFLVWNAIKVYRQWVLCGCNSSYSFPLIALKLCWWILHGIMEWRCACDFGIILWLFFLTFSALWT